MLRRSHILTTTALLAVCAGPASAAIYEDLHDTSPPPSSIATVTESPSGGLDWGHAGIGAAGMVALFGIAGGSALLRMGRKRRQDVRVATQ